jgi:hypothetical protein
MDVNHMKPYITPEISDAGHKLLRLQCENIEPKDIRRKTLNLSVVAYSMPPKHSFQAAWIFRLIFNNGNEIEFSSACTMVDSWQEAGSLNIQFMEKTMIEQSGEDSILLKVEIKPLLITSLIKLVYEGNEYESECGLIIVGETGQSITITTGVSPGSVSIKAPFSTSHFEPEFSLVNCRQISLD